MHMQSGDLILPDDLNARSRKDEHYCGMPKSHLGRILNLVAITAGRHHIKRMERLRLVQPPQFILEINLLRLSVRHIDHFG